MDRLKTIKAIRQQVRQLTARGRHYEARQLEAVIYDL